MGSWTSLRLGIFDLGSSKDDIDPTFMMLFRESDKRVHQATLDEIASRYVVEAPLDASADRVTIVEYACSTSVARDRLELLGFSRNAAEAQFREGIQEEIARCEGLEPLATYYLPALRQMTMENWVTCLSQIGRKGLKKRRVVDGTPARRRGLMSYLLTHDLYGYPGDPLHFLRLLVDVCPGKDELVYDVTDLVSGGYMGRKRIWSTVRNSLCLANSRSWQRP